MPRTCLLHCMTQQAAYSSKCGLALLRQDIAQSRRIAACAYSTTPSNAAQTFQLLAHCSPPLFAGAIGLSLSALPSDATRAVAAPATASAAEAAFAAKPAPAAPATSTATAAPPVGFAGAEALHVRCRRCIVLLGEPLAPAEPIPRVASFSPRAGVSTSCTHT